MAKGHMPVTQETEKAMAVKYDFRVASRSWRYRGEEKTIQGSRMTRQSHNDDAPEEMKKPQQENLLRLEMHGAPCRIRTCDHMLRRHVLYPTELRAHTA